MQQPDDLARQSFRIGNTHLSRMGNGERNSTNGEGPRGPSERARASQPGQSLAKIGLVEKTGNDAQASLAGTAALRKSLQSPH
jgi:hypothetical protein